MSMCSFVKLGHRVCFRAISQDATSDWWFNLLLNVLEKSLELALIFQLFYTVQFTHSIYKNAF